jgi:hypothetical protein
MHFNSCWSTDLNSVLETKFIYVLFIDISDRYGQIILSVTEMEMFVFIRFAQYERKIIGQAG